jgi:hypothetical protein
MLLYHIVKLSKYSQICEIGSYIGWSTVHIALALREVSTNGLIICIDPFIEKNSHIDSDFVYDTFKANITKAGVQDLIKIVRDYSPKVLSSVAPSNGWELVFIDGWHLDGQPLRDIIGVVPHVSTSGVIVLHDVWMPDVRDGLIYLLAHGWEGLILPTANYLSVLWRKERTPPWLRDLMAIAKKPPFYLQRSQSLAWRYGLTPESIKTAVQSLTGQEAKVLFLWNT